VYRGTDDLRHHDVRSRDAVVEALRFSVGVAAAAVVVMVAAELWVGTCAGSTFDAVACGAPQRTLFALGAPLILLGGGVRAFVRTHQVRREHGIWWPWQGAGWFLMAAMLLVLARSVPSIVVP
jgi:hypothetical protein